MDRSPDGRIITPESVSILNAYKRLHPEVTTIQWILDEPIIDLHTKNALIHWKNLLGDGLFVWKLIPDSLQPQAIKNMRLTPEMDRQIATIQDSQDYRTMLKNYMKRQMLK
jgi:hypothetical protein